MLKNQKIKTKIMVALLFVVVSLSLAGAYGLVKINKIGEEIQDIAEQDVPLLNALSRITTYQLEQAINFERALRHGQTMAESASDKADFNKAEDTYLENGTKVKNELSSVAKLLDESISHASSDKQRREFTKVASAISTLDKEHADYEKHVENVFHALKNGHIVEATAAAAKIEIEEEKFDHELEALNQEIQNFTEEAAKTAEHDEQAAFTNMSLAILLATVFGCIFGLVISSNISRSLVHTKEALEEIAEGDGDLTRRLNEDGKDEIAGLSAAFNKFTVKIENMVSQISQTATSIHRASEEVSEGNTDLSARTEEQASSLEETASSMEEMTATVKQNADSSSQANQLAATAREQAERGGKVLKEATGAMGEISTASSKISQIIKVVENISFQTNLLALNAAVEAARAGEQGRGFAVVASEVRSLAQRSSEAAKEVKDLIEDSVSKVNRGTELVDHSAQTLEEIVNSVKKVSDIVSEITAASQEQATGITQVNNAVMQMDEITQQNSSLVEESMAASQSLQAQAGLLTNMVAQFKISSRFESPAPVEVAKNWNYNKPTHKTIKTTQTKNIKEEKTETKTPGKIGTKQNEESEQWEEF